MFWETATAATPRDWLSGHATGGTPSCICIDWVGKDTAGRVVLSFIAGWTFGVRGVAVDSTQQVRLGAPDPVVVQCITGREPQPLDPGPKELELGSTDK